MELLAPAGSWDAFLAALGNGADAVYLGGKNYSARQLAANFDSAQIKAAIEYAHLRDKRVYITVNTLIDNGEFNAVLDHIFGLYRAGADAIIIQDLGLMAAVRRIFPDLPVHASTQMTVHNSAGARFLAGQGVGRIVLAREMKQAEIASVCREVPEMEFEVFVHGALCYSYSGQCLFSSLLGGRSGNRGNCAQPCRLPYRIKAAHASHAAKGRSGYLLSPADLCLIDEIALLDAAGVASLKIEGRMKRPEYVAVVTRAYREALDRFAHDPAKAVGSECKERLLGIFNRGFCGGHFIGDKNSLMSRERPDNRGVEIGRVTGQNRDYLTSIELTAPLKIGDGLQIRNTGGVSLALQVKEIRVKNGSSAQADAGEVISLKLYGKTAAGARVFKTHDSGLIEAARASIKVAGQERLLVDVDVYLREGEPLLISYRDENGNHGAAASRSVAQTAQKQPLDETILRDKLDKLGNTPYILNRINLYGERNLLVPFSELNDARRRAIEQLKAMCLQSYAHPELQQDEYLNRRRSFSDGLSARHEDFKAETKISISVGGSSEAHAAIIAGAGRVYLQLEGMAAQGRPRLKEIHPLLDQGRMNGCEVVLVLPRIQKPGDYDYKKYLDCRPDSVMAGNIGSMNYCLDKGLKVRGDYSLNIFNPAALEFLLNQGVEGQCLSPELGFRQLQSFNNLDKVEMLVHGEIILMCSEFCVLRETLGSWDVKCPAFCRRDQYYLEDQKGYRFPVASDSECRFYLFNSRTLCLVEELGRILSLRPESIRIEALRASTEETSSLVSLYRKALLAAYNSDKAALAACKEQLAGVSPSPFTRAHFNRGVV